MDKTAHISLIKSGLSRFTDALLMRGKTLNVTPDQVACTEIRRGFYGYKQVVTLTDGRQYQVRMDKASVDGVSYDHKDRGAAFAALMASSSRAAQHSTQMIPFNLSSKPTFAERLSNPDCENYHIVALNYGAVNMIDPAKDVVHFNMKGASRGHFAGFVAGSKLQHSGLSLYETPDGRSMYVHSGNVVAVKKDDLFHRAMRKIAGLMGIEKKEAAVLAFANGQKLRVTTDSLAHHFSNPYLFFAPPKQKTGLPKVSRDDLMRQGVRERTRATLVQGHIFNQSVLCRL